MSAHGKAMAEILSGHFISGDHVDFMRLSELLGDVVQGAANEAFTLAAMVAEAHTDIDDSEAMVASNIRRSILALKTEKAPDRSGA